MSTGQCPTSKLTAVYDLTNYKTGHIVQSTKNDNLNRMRLSFPQESNNHMMAALHRVAECKCQGIPTQLGHFDKQAH